MLVSEIILAAVRKLGAIASGETIGSSMQDDALESLQVMLRSWSAEKINVFSSVHEDFTLVAGTASYTWGSGGDITTARPNKITGASILESSITYPVEIISEGKYREIAAKTTVSRPYYLYPEYNYPLITINVYPVPVSADTLKLESLKPFTETSSFTATSDTIAMPSHYQEAVIYGLAIRVAPEIGKEVPLSVAAIARSSYDRITKLNSSNQVEPVGVVVPAGIQGRYSINSDCYR